MIGMNQYLTHMPLGQLASMLATDEPTDEPTERKEFVLLLKESGTMLDRFDTVVLVNLWGATKETDEAVAMTVELDWKGQHYTAWLDYKSVYGKVAVDQLCKQESILLRFVNESGHIVGNIKVDSPLREKALVYREIAERHTDWQPSQFRLLMHSNPQRKALQISQRKDEGSAETLE